MEYIGNWKFWLAVIVVVVATHLVMSFVMPQMKASGG